MSKTIKSVKLLYPSLMKESAANQILDLYSQLEAKEAECTKCFMRQQVLTKEIDDIKNTLTNLKNTYELIYEEGKVKEIVAGEAPTIVESNGTIHI